MKAHPEQSGNESLACDFQHAVEREARIRRDAGSDGDLVDHTAFNQIFERPEHVLRVDAEHRRAEATAVVERNDEPVRVFSHEPVHEMDFRTDGPPRAGRRLGQAFDNVFGGAAVV